MRRYTRIGTHLLAAAALMAMAACTGPSSQPAGGTAAPNQSGAPPQNQSGAPPEAQQPPSATLTFTGGQFALGIGYSWGNGVITYEGEERSFHISGFTIVNVGVTNLSATGEVYNLHRLEDFPGTYAAAGAGATIGGGVNVLYLRNQNGVVIKVTATSQGLDFQLSGNGLKITF